MPSASKHNLIENEEVVKSIKKNVNNFFIEECGLILSDGKDITVEKCENISNSPDKNFLISRKQINDIAQDKEIIGYYHSHPDDNQPSIQDYIVSAKLKIPCLIHNNQTGEISQTTLPDTNYIPNFEKRPFIAGYLDCSDLVKDYYEKALNIILPKLEHPIKYMSWEEIKANWDSLQEYNRADYNFFYDYFINCGFYPIQKKDLRPNDIILCRATEIAAPIHAMIFLGGERILHHPSERESLIENYNKFYQKLSVNYLRYRD
ncbi:conserved hypothetical protein [Gammaproteobacteria bacterium]